jgi:molybdopterin biosynthesis enzyme MoaB
MTVTALIIQSGGVGISERDVSKFEEKRDKHLAQFNFTLHQIFNNAD